MILAAGQAATLFAQQPAKGPITICDQSGRPRWHPLWAGNPVVRVPTFEPTGPFIQFGGGCLPYLHYPHNIETGWQFTSWRARDHRGAIYLTEAETRLGQHVADRHGPFVLLEPSGSDRKNANRCWPLASWHRLAEMVRRMFGMNAVQLHHAHAELIPGVYAIPHETFRDACGILNAATLAILPEGGLAHAAMALKVPAVVLWGGCISVDTLGYPEHSNCVDDSTETPCGSLKPCVHCAQAWRRLTPSCVAEQAGMLLASKVGA